MRRSTLSTLLLAGGVTVGVAATVALFAGFEPAPLSPLIVKIALYKLTFIASGALLIAGAVVGRWARRSEAQSVNQHATVLRSHAVNASLADQRVHDAQLLGVEQRAVLERQSVDEQQHIKPNADVRPRD